MCVYSVMYYFIVGRLLMAPIISGGTMIRRR